MKEIKLKTCRTCKKDKPETTEYFYFKKTRDKFETECIECAREKCQKYYQEHKEENSIKCKQYREEHKEELSLKGKKYRQENKEKISTSRKEYREDNKEKISLKKKKYYEENKEKISLKKKQYRQENKEKLILQDKKYREKHKEKKRLRDLEYRKQRKLSDPAFKIKCIVSNRIYLGLKSVGASKENRPSWDFLPYSPEELKQHLEAQFEFWMNWENHGVYHPRNWNNNDPSTWTWQIDHIIPHSEFLYYSLEDENLQKCWALDNLRPLSAKQNHANGLKVRHKKK